MVFRWLFGKIGKFSFWENFSCILV